jgi:phosphoserine phosphatase RsbU/P
MAETTESLRCMEVWGGNRGIEQAFALPGLDLWLYSRPIAHAENGGDVYYLSSCASGRISRLLLADVSGHGPEVSQLALRLRDLMRKNINRISQTQFVEGMNEEFVQFNQESRFATALVGTYFSSSGDLQLCTAGHPQPLIYRAQKNVWEVLELNRHPSSTGNIPLGILAEVNYGQIDLPMELGDMMLAYTDGIVEAQVDGGQMLGTEGLLSMVQSLEVTEPEKFIGSLVAKLESKTIKPIEDDFTIMLARCNSRPVSLVNNLLAPFRLLTEARDGTSFREGSAT